MLLVGLFVLGALSTLCLLSWAWSRVMADPVWSRAFVGGMLRGLERQHGVITVRCYAELDTDEEAEQLEQLVTVDIEELALAIATLPATEERRAA